MTCQQKQQKRNNIIVANFTDGGIQSYWWYIDKDGKGTIKNRLKKQIKNKIKETSFLQI